MPQIFPKWVNNLPLYVAAVAAVAGIVAPAFIWYYFSPEYTDVGYAPVQPVEYSHELHAGEMGLDCRYCHSQVEVAAVASIPPTKVCMNCHSLVKRDSPKLTKIVESMSSGRPVEWIRIHEVPDYAFFDHSVHVNAGVGCQSCHGDIRAMEVVRLEEPLSMGWCLECHRNPDPHLRPLDEVYDTDWKAPDNQIELAAQYKEERGLRPPEDCTSCHR